ncbi:MAG TPA: DUF5719 family protein [Acidimicrobiales bacterium]|nr:DUF5719 family protein [Acidimicrobiales bacterium]
MSRRPVLTFVSVVLAVMAVAGWRLDSGAGFPGPPAPAVTTVMGSAADQEWYCSVATAVSGGQAAGEIVLANSGSSTLTGTVTVYGNQGQTPSARAFTLAPWSRAVLGEQPVLTTPFAAATVVFHGGGGAAEQEISGPLGVSVTPCAGRPSSNWYFAAGTTRPGASLVLALFNPFPENALADLSFADPQGLSAPAEFQGIFVPSGGLVTIDVGQHVVQVDDIAATVRVRVGRLVASELQLDGIPNQAGLSLVLGAPAPAGTWYLPDGVEASGVSESLHLYNPSAGPAGVTIDLNLARGRAAPFQLSVAAGSEAVVDLAGQTRIPLDDPYDVVVKAHGAPVVAERTVIAVAPSTRTGAASMMGAPTPARMWLMGAGGAGPSQDEWIDIFDPGRRAATVTLSYLAGGSDPALTGLRTITVPAGGRSALRLGDHIQLADLSVLVASSVPVVAERDLYQVGSIGISTSLGEPVS